MFEFAHPLLFLILPLPWLVERYLPAYRRRKDALRVPFYAELLSLTGAQASSGAVVTTRSKSRMVALIGVWCCIVIAIAAPQQVGQPVVHEKSARDLMVAVDLSGSMQNTDFVNKAGSSIDRLSAVKTVLTQFSQQRQHDRLGLIVFGDTPFLQAPFTQDHDTWRTLLDETEIGMAGNNTSLGDAIGLAIKHFLSNDSDNRILIVLTDGNDTGSKVPPIEAAKVAANYAVTIYPIAIGDPASQGEQALDTNTMKRMAALTGGEFYQAFDRIKLQQIYQRIALLEPQLFSTKSHRPRTSLHHYPMILATFIMLFYAMLVGWQLVGPACRANDSTDNSASKPATTIATKGNQS